jgi:hypothetical protein
MKAGIKAIAPSIVVNGLCPPLIVLPGLTANEPSKVGQHAFPDQMGIAYIVALPSALRFACWVL